MNVAQNQAARVQCAVFPQHVRLGKRFSSGTYIYTYLYIDMFEKFTAKQFACRTTVEFEKKGPGDSKTYRFWFG